MSPRKRRGWISLGAGRSCRATALRRAVALLALLLSGAAASAATISGTVFEDVNYGGGAGRSWATTSAGGGTARPGARVELFDGTGAYVTSTNTDASGNYSFTVLAAASFTVRVVSSSVTSSRTGYVAGLLPVLTFRTDASTGTAVGVTDHVGGHDPSTADAGNAAAGWVLNSATGVFSGSGSGRAHAFAPVTTSVVNVTGVDFGWNFDTIANVNNAGQGSLRQLLTNANTLGGDASLAQVSRTAGIESGLFMVSNGTAAPGLRAANNYFVAGVAIISPTSALPTLSTPVILDAQTQPGWVSTPIIRIDGATAGGVGLLLSGTSDGSAIRGLMITRFSSDGIRVQSGGDSITIAGNWIGTTGTGSTGVGNGDDGVELRGSLATIGGTNANDGNVVTNSGDEGIDIVGTGATRHLIQGNLIGVDPDGSSGNGNGDVGIAIISGSENTIGGASAEARNVISRNFEGIEINTNNNTVRGNYIGTDVGGTANRGNQSDDGVEIQGGATGNRIGFNLIAFNALDGVHVRNGSGNPVLGNSIWGNGGIGIDLANNGVTANDGVKTAGQANLLMDHPVFTGAVINGAQLSVTGYVGSAPSQPTFGGARVEIFESDGDATGFGEGRTYLGFLTADANGNFAGTLDVSGLGLAAGERITGTATDGTNNTSEFGANAFVAVAAAVDLVSFEALASDGAVELMWETGTEMDNLGFHLYRSLSAAGPFERITASLIPGLGSSPQGARYGFRDVGLVNGVTYHYLLEDLETTGATKHHGPVSATPQVGLDDAADDSSEDDTDPTESAPVWVTYGDPEATSLHVLERGRGHVVVELITGGFYALPETDGSVRLSIPGFQEASQAGSPAIPVRQTWLEAVAGRKVRLTSVVGRDVVSFDGLRPAVAGEPELWEATDGTLHPGVRRRPAGRAFRAAGLYPEKAARVPGTAFQADEKKVQLELAPLRWDRSAVRLLLARRLRVKLVFAGRENGERAFGGARGRARRGRKGRGVEGVVARLAVEAPGLYGVPFEDVPGIRNRGVRSSELFLSHRGEAAAFHVEPAGKRFGPGSVLFFESAGGDLNPYGRAAVYELSLSGGGVRMPVASAEPAGGSLPYYWQRDELEENRLYQPTLFSAPDRWLWDYIPAGRTRSYAFPVSGLVSAAEPGRLELWLQGASDYPADPDHHVQVSVNGQAIAEASWDDKQPYALEAVLGSTLLREGENSLEITNRGDTGASYSLVVLDRFAVSYPRTTVARAGTLAGPFPDRGTATVEGVAPGTWVLDTTERFPRWLVGAVTSPSGTSFAVEAGRTYHVVSPEALRRPEVRQAIPGTLHDETNRADYLVVGPRPLLEAAEPLVEHRRGQGLEARAVAIEDVYDDFGFGEQSPEALRDFLTHAYHQWELPPRYVLLLGDASYDFKDHLGVGVGNPVPPYMIQDAYMWTVSDPAYASVNGADLLPDLAIGRLPAQTQEQAQVLVQKTLAWENAGFDLSGRAVLVADNSDHGGNFEGDAELAAQRYLSDRELERIYLSQLGRAARGPIMDAFDRGSSLMSFLGHGSIAIWASENVFNNWDVPNLAPQAQQPLLLTMNCLNGYFTLPSGMNSLAEELLKAEDRGVIGAVSPSSMSPHWAARLYHEALLEELTSGEHQRLGDALLAAQTAYVDSGASIGLLAIYQFLGDPALRIRY